ncbi:unnamed protein product, partial [Urochloa humidicola]
VPGEAAARPHLGLKGEAAAATLDGRRRRPRRSSSVRLRAAAVQALGEANRLATPPLRPFGPSVEPATVDDADRAPGRRGTVVADDSTGQYLTWALLLSNCPHRPPSNSRVPKILAGRRSIPAVQDPRRRLLPSKISTGCRLAFDCGH